MSPSGVVAAVANVDQAESEFWEPWSDVFIAPFDPSRDNVESRVGTGTAKVARQRHCHPADPAADVEYIVIGPKALFDKEVKECFSDGPEIASADEPETFRRDHRIRLSTPPVQSIDGAKDCRTDSAYEPARARDGIKLGGSPPAQLCRGQ